MPGCVGATWLVPGALRTDAGAVRTGRGGEGGLWEWGLRGPPELSSNGREEAEGACTDGPLMRVRATARPFVPGGRGLETSCLSTCSGRRQGAVPRPALVTGCKVPAPGDPRQSAPPDRLALDFGATRMLWQLPSLLKLLRVARGSPPQQSFEGH